MFFNDYLCPNKMKISILYCLFLLSLGGIFLSCKKDSIPSQNTPLSEELMLVLNEGNFMSGNSTLSVINHNGTVIEDIFREKNGFGLGDVGQSLYYHQNKIYLVANNSNKIYQLDLNFKVTGIISGLTSPRYFLPVNDSIALVTDLYANGVYVINYKNLTIVKKIDIPGWTEELIFYRNKVWVTNPYAGALYIIHPQTLILEDSLILQGSYGSTDIDVDAYGNLWVLCWGNANLNIQPSLVKIQYTNIEKTFVFPTGTNPSRLTLSKDKATLFWLNNGVYKMPVTKNELSIQPFISSGNKNFYNLYIHPETDEIWVADAKDYVQKGEVLHYSADGNFIKSYKVGIIPSFMMYLKK